MLRRVLLFLFGFPVLVWAQSYTASVRGIVTDQTQAAVPAAQVTLTDVNRNQVYTTIADSEGRYVLASLPPGTYLRGRFPQVHATRVQAGSTTAGDHQCAAIAGRGD